MVSVNPVVRLYLVHWLMLICIFVASSLCHYPVRCARSRSRFDTKGTHRVLQHCTVVCSQILLAVPLEGYYPV